MENEFLYELGNHLGNVLEVVTDRKLAVETAPESGVVDYYIADVVSQSDYYPFGMLLPNRNESEADYRYGYQGSEKDDEVRGSKGTSYTTHFRQLDPRVGRWLSVDPKEKSLPNLSPYCSMDNTPLAANDMRGDKSDWIPETQEDGSLSLKKEEGDNAQSLVNYFKNDWEQMQKMLPENVYKELIYKNRTNALNKPVTGEFWESNENNPLSSVKLNDNVFSQSIAFANGEEDWSGITYDCKDFVSQTVLNGSPMLQKEPLFGDKGKDPNAMNLWGKLWSKKVEVNKDEQDPGNSNEMVPGKSFAYWGVFFDHAAVYFGTDSNGMNYWITKNGQGDSKPVLMSQDELEAIYFLWFPDYYAAPQ